MNTETGRIYRDPEEITAAIKRGEPVEPVSEEVARIVEEGHAAINRKERRRLAALARKARKDGNS